MSGDSITIHLCFSRHITSLCAPELYYQGIYERNLHFDVTEQNRSVCHAPTVPEWFYTNTRAPRKHFSFASFDKDITDDGSNYMLWELRTWIKVNQNIRLLLPYFFMQFCKGKRTFLPSWNARALCWRIQCVTLTWEVSFIFGSTPMAGSPWEFFEQLMSSHACKKEDRGK